jgi:hypothetical protein
VIDYYLQAAPASAVTLEILDVGGKPVRRFSSDDRVEPPRESPQIATEWLPRHEPPTRDAGHNRFVWDLRYPPPQAERYGYSIAAIAGQGTVAEPEGPLVLPGEYQVRLTVDGRSLTQPLRVERDPRIHVADTALVAQLRLALEIGSALGSQRALQAALRGVRDQLRTLQGAAGAAGAGAGKLDTQSASTVAALGRSVDSLVQASGGGGELAGLETVVESADREPTDQAREAYAEVQRRLARAERRWQEVRTTDLPALNARLQQRGLAPLSY